MVYFAYGSNLDVKRMRKRCPDATLIGKGMLHNHQLQFTRHSPAWGCGVADIVTSKDDSVWGLLYELSRSDLLKLDVYEGHPTAYRRAKVSIRTAKGIVHDVWVYTVVDKVRFVKPSREYLNTIKNACEQHGFPEEYKKHVDSFRTINV